jgi:hypothetical protein
MLKHPNIESFMAHHSCDIEEDFVNTLKHPSAETPKCTKMFHVKSMFA